MRILVLGSGAREHSVIRALLNDPSDYEIIAAPGNAGISEEVVVAELRIEDPEAVSEFARDHQIELVIVGPEAPLIAGVAGALRTSGIPVFGPSTEAAAIEGSKSFAKEIMASAKIPTAKSVLVATEKELAEALDGLNSPHVVKADGLAGGKGVVVTEDRDQAMAHGTKHLQNGNVLVEEFLEGQEVSLFFISDGTSIIPLSPAQDYKRAFDHDRGPNTGGMGAYSPVPWLDDSFIKNVTETIARPVVSELKSRGTPFVGLLYCGLIVQKSEVKVIEFNARFGDPETQAVLARLKSPLGPMLLAAASGRLNEIEPPEFDSSCSIVVVIASEGYPDHPTVGRKIIGLENLPKISSVSICHGATKWVGSDLFSTGGRVLSVVSIGKTFSLARDNAYETINLLHLEGSYFRTDIGLRVST